MSNLPPPDPATRITEYAGFWNRAIARVADGLLALLYTLPFIVGGIFLIVLSVRDCPLARRLGVKVVCQRTLQPIGIPRSIGRFFGQYISAWIFYLGYLWMLWDKDKQTWHDKMVNSIVIRTGI